MTESPARSEHAQQRMLDVSLLRGMGTVALFVAIANAAKLAQDAAIAWRLGTSATVDAYYFLLNLASWPVAIGVALLTYMIAPMDSRLQVSDPAAARQFRGELFASALALAVVALPVTWWVMRAVAASAVGGLNAPAAAQALPGADALAAIVPLGLLGALFSAWLVAAGRHVLALLEGVPALLVAVLVVVFPGPVLFWGTAVGYVLQVAVMAWVLRRHGELPAPRLRRGSVHWRVFSHVAVLLLAAQALFSLVPLVDTFFAARMGEGVLASLSYTNRLLLGLQGLAGLALQRSGLPLLARLSMDSPAAARHAAGRWAAAMAAVGVVAAVAVAALADPIVALLFERGGFTAADSAECARLLRFGVVHLPAFLASMALVTGLAAVGAHRAIAFVAIANVAVKVVASFLLAPVLGAAGLLLATACMYLAAVGLAWFALRAHISRGAA